MNNEKITKGVKIVPNQTNEKITHAQKLKDQCKFKEALETLSSIENVNELTVNEQISFYLLQSSLFYDLGPYNKALDAVDRIFQKCIKTGNDLVVLDASLARGSALLILGKNEECYDSILKCEELISRIKEQPEEIIGKRKVELSILKGWYYLWVGEFDKDKTLEYLKKSLYLSKKYGTKRDIAKSFAAIGAYYMVTGDFAKALENQEKKLNINKEINNKYGILGAYIDIGWIYYKRGDLVHALEYYEKFWSLFEEKGPKIGMAFILECSGAIFYEKGEFTKALNYLKRSYQLFKEIGDNYRISEVLRESISIYLDQNDLESAEFVWKK